MVSLLEQDMFSNKRCEADKALLRGVLRRHVK